jgi:hypothetical protein
MKAKLNLCSKCGKIHKGWPALAFDSPTSYNELPQELKKEIGELKSDFCIVKHPDQTDRFIRGTLTIKVVDFCEDLDYGVWVSLSEKSFQDYSDNFNNSNHKAKYFGWLSNDIPDYSVIKSIPTTVFTRLDGLRPEIIPHENFDHQLVFDYYHGITKQEAERRIDEMLIAIRKRDNLKTRPWWKIW